MIHAVEMTSFGTSARRTGLYHTRRVKVVNDWIAAPLINALASKAMVSSSGSLCSLFRVLLPLSSAIGFTAGAGWLEGTSFVYRHLIVDADRFCRTIRLPGSDGPIYTTTSDSGPLATLASIPWFLVGLGGIAYESVASQFNTFRARYRARRGYRHVPVDEDAQILRFEDEE